MPLSRCQSWASRKAGVLVFSNLSLKVLLFLEHFHVFGNRIASELCGSFQHSPKQMTTAATTVWPCPLESVWTTADMKKNHLAWKLNFFSPAPLCLPSHVAGSNLLKALSKAIKHLAAAGSIRMPLWSSFKQLPAIKREMNLQRHLCHRSSDTLFLACTDTLLSDRPQEDVWLGSKGFSRTWSTCLR